MKTKIVVICITVTIYVTTYVIFYETILRNSEEIGGERSVSDGGEEALFSGQFKNVNINSAVASVIGKYLLKNYTGNYNWSRLVLGDTEYWRQGIAANTGSSSGAPLGGGKEGEGERKCRRVYIIRHTEKISKVTPDWAKLAFDANGSYKRVDLNMPVVLPRRNRHPSYLVKDPPISLTGHIQAWLIGHCLREIGVTVSHVYSSPTLRCIESANTMLLGMGLDVMIKVEPTLLEWFKWSKQSVVMDMEELRRYDLNVDVNYQPFIRYDEINYDEDRLAEYQRCYMLIKRIVDSHKEDGGDILIVGHLSTMETIPRIITGGQPLPYKTFINRVYEKPFGLISVMEEDCHGNRSWRKVLPPTLPITWHARLLSDTEPIINLLLT